MKRQRIRTLEDVRARCVVDDNGCWLWQLAINPRGYAVYHTEIGGMRFHLAHRIAYWLASGHLTPGLHVHHDCYQSRCCNPEHLREITPKENNLDEGCSGRARVNIEKQGCPRCGAEYEVHPKSGWRYCRPCKNANHRRLEKLRYDTDPDFRAFKQRKIATYPRKSTEPDPRETMRQAHLAHAEAVVKANQPQRTGASEEA